MMALRVVLPIAPGVAARPLLRLLPLPLPAALARLAGGFAMTFREADRFVAALSLLRIVVLAPGVGRTACGQESGIPAPRMARPAHPSARGDSRRRNRGV